MKALGGIVMTVAILAGCAAQPSLLKETASGQAEAICEGSRAQVRDMLVARAVSKGWAVDEATEAIVRISQREDSVAGGLLLGSGSQRRFAVQWTLLAHENAVRVIGTAELASQQVYGQTQRIGLSSNAVRNNLQNALWENGVRVKAGRPTST